MSTIFEHPSAPAPTPSATRRWQRLVLGILKFAAGYLQRMPRAQAMRWGERIGRLAHFVTRRFAGRSQRHAHRNLQLTGFPRPEMSFRERDAFIRDVFIHFSKVMVDFLRGPALTASDLENLLSVEGVEHLDQAIRTQKGVILVTGHFGNWELMARYIVARGCPLTVVAREPEDPDFAGYVQYLRENGGYRVMYRGSSTVREMLTLLKRKEGVGLLPDQNSGDLFIPFFGIPAGTVEGPAALALHTGATLIPCFCPRLPDDTYRLHFLPPLDTEVRGDKQATRLRIMTELNQILEEMVRQYPEQWLWLHNRWKSAFEEHNRSRAFPGGFPEKLGKIWNRNGA